MDILIDQECEDASGEMRCGAKCHRVQAGACPCLPALKAVASGLTSVDTTTSSSRILADRMFTSDSKP
eukprot:gene3034-5817_t